MRNSALWSQLQLKKWEIKVKVKLTLEEATKAQSGSRGTALLFL
jgi:hypothetical protein